MMAYYDDCGYSPHVGDSEMVTVEVQFNATTRHWEFVRMWTSAHYNATVFGVKSDRSEWSNRYDAVFHDRQLAFPVVWVAEDKHANYRNVSRCQGWTGSSYLHKWQDWCGSFNRIRFPVPESYNAGSRYVDLLGCVFSHRRGTSSGRTECFYRNRGDGFRGWSASTDKEISTYHFMLFSSYNFENYLHEDGSYAYTSF